MARRRDGIDERPLPARPYRDTVVVYGIMAVILVAISGLTGGSLARAFVAGVGFFVIATAWSWWRFRVRIRERAAREALGGTAATTGVDRPDGEPVPDAKRSGSNGAASGNGNGRLGGKR